MISTVLQILGVALLQLAILPSVSLASVDLAVAWLIVYAVHKSLSSTIAVAACLALIMETYGVVPFGAYFGAYWLVIVAVHALRHLVVWKLSAPWLVAFAVAEVVVLVIEALMIDLTYVHLGNFLFQSILRIVATSAAGLVLLKISQRYGRILLEANRRTGHHFPSGNSSSSS